MASLYICLYCTILTTLTWLTCWSISRWCYLQSTALAGLCSMNAKTCKCMFPILWNTSLLNKIFWWIVVEVLSERLCWMSKRQFKRKYDILRHCPWSLQYKASNVKKTAGKSATSHVDSLRLLTELRDNATYPSLETILNDSSSVWCTPGSVAWQDRLTS